MCVPRPIDLVVIDKKSSISFRLKFGKQSEEGSISNYPLPEGNYFSLEPIVSLPMLEQCSSASLLVIPVAVSSPAISDT